MGQEAPQKILVPLDVSRLATVAVDHAATLAAATGASLVLYLAVGGEERSALQEFAANERIAIDEAADAHLSRVAAGVAGDVVVEQVHQYSNNPAVSIVDYATAHDLSQIVMASHGRSGVGRWLLGSVARKVVETSTIPVTVIPVRD